MKPNSMYDPVKKTLSVTRKFTPLRFNIFDSKFTEEKVEEKLTQEETKIKLNLSDIEIQDKDDLTLGYVFIPKMMSEKMKSLWKDFESL